MSGVGFSELIILFLIGLIVLGPERLPRVANQLGTWLGQARRMTRVMKRQLEEEINLEGAPPSIGAPRHTPHDEDTFSPAHVPAPEAAVEETTSPPATDEDDAGEDGDEEKSNA